MDPALDTLRPWRYELTISSESIRKWRDQLFIGQVQQNEGC